MTDSDLARQVNTVARLTGTFTLRSGRTATEYFDKYQFESDPVLLDALAAQLAVLIPEGTEVLAGLEMGGIAVVTALGRHAKLPCAFVRKEAKKYGTARLAEGAEVAGRRVLVVEDTSTTGGSPLTALAAVKEAGAVPVGVAVIVDRATGAAEKIEAEGVPYLAAYGLGDLGLG